MKVGVYFDVRVPAGVAPARIYAQTLELCEEAERLGADSVWFSEHHAFDDGYLPDPLTMAAAAAARTKRVRVGTALVIAPLRSAVGLAEQAAVVDLVSDGRLELGVGPGYRPTEFELYGQTARYASRHDATDQTVRELRALWGEGRVTPAPAQERIPIWMGFAGPRGARRAGLLGEGLLFLNPELLDPYTAALAEAGHPRDAAAIATPVFGCASEDPERDWPLISKHVAYQQDSYLRHAVQGTGLPAPPAVDADKLRAGEENGATGYFWFGTPEEIAARTCALISGLPVDTVFFWGSVGAMPQELAARNVAIICNRIAPLIRGD